jgi:hypothetical protein
MKAGTSEKSYTRSPTGFYNLNSVADSECLSRIRIFQFRIPDPGSKKFLDPDPHQRVKVFLTQKLFLSSRKYYLGC